MHVGVNIDLSIYIKSKLPTISIFTQNKIMFQAVNIYRQFRVRTT